MFKKLKMRIQFIIFIATTFIIGISCKKQPEISASNKIDIGNTFADTVSYYTSDVNTIIVALGGNEITQHGHCWSIDDSPSIDDSITTLGELNLPDTVVSKLNNLNANTAYNIRSYITYKDGTIYGNQIEIKTYKVQKPIITTNDVNSINTSWAICGGFNDNGGLIITARGVCWNTTGNPNLTDFHTNDVVGIGSFSSGLLDLENNTKYFVAAYATNDIGIAYGDVVQFTTSSIVLPTVTTNAPTNVTSNYATSGGNITNNGYSDIEAKGVCWNTEGNPTLLNNHGFTNEGNNTDSFTSNISDLTNNTTYFVTAYATNEVGTAYGEIYEFIAEDLPCGDLTVNYGGQIYHTVMVGTQCWMKENLNIGIKVVANEEMQDNGIIEKFCYNDDEANCDIYGGLYNWDEMMQYTTTNNDRGICPIGWHVPSDEEWKVLEGNSDTQYGVGNSIWDQEEYRGYDAGKRLKTTTGWISNTGTNNFDFSVLPGGFRKLDGYFRSVNELSYIWTSTDYHGSSRSWIRFFDANNNKIYRSKLDPRYGFSVRCIKN